MNEGTCVNWSYTGKAASYSSGPMVHGMFGLSQFNLNSTYFCLDATTKKCLDNRTAHEDIERILTDETRMLPSYLLGLVDEIMTLSFNSNRIINRKTKKVPPFGGKRIIFVGDMAQLPPVNGAPFYRLTKTALSAKHLSGLKIGQSKQAQAVDKNYMHLNATIFQKRHRNRYG